MGSTYSKAKQTASAYGIVKNHGGFITIYSEVGNGTTFNIYLPISTKAATVEPVVRHALAKGSETILLVDDEELVAEVAQAMLETLGYTVRLSNSGPEAIAVVEEDGEAIDLVVLDLVMPGMDGSKVFDAIRRIQPALPVLLSSGYSVNELASDVLKKGCNGFIIKPYNISEFSQMIRKVLDAL